jgi:predicted ATPase/class 3 adenylate cyclase
VSVNPDPTSAASSGQLPSGTVAFAFTDIEGSTQRWELDRTAMQDAVRRHDALIRTAIVENRGYVFKTVGDAFCAAFHRPEDAIAAMLAAQRATAAEDFSSVNGLRVRAAIHTGTAEERDGDYFGPAVNRVARLLAIGHGGQVLVSGVTADLVQGVLPPRASLRDLGEHRLKDLARPEQVYQLLAPDLTTEFPQLRSLDALPNNLPRMLTSFVGRESEISEITSLIERNRLVTLVGSGGIGKTRTSLQVAANMLDGSGDGVWFIELAPLASGDYIPSAVAQSLGVSLTPSADPVDDLARALKAKNALLVFDNCEHVIEPVGRVIAAVLRGCPKVRVLASSRQGLGLAGEMTYRLASLPVPPESGTSDATALEATRYAALALFVDRACAVDQRFTLTDENAATITEVCRRLDGIPLAIELAASRVKILSPRQLRDRLQERFRVLTGGSRDALPRQQTLRAMIDWSHDLLDERERTLFRRLGIFADGFTLEAATAVGSGVDLDEFDVLDVLASLVDKSLVIAEPAGDSLRYRFLESTRVYAREKLEAVGERELCAERHARHFRDRFIGPNERYEGTGRRAELEKLLATEVEDVRAALDWALDGDVRLGAELLADIRDFWRSVGLDPEGIARGEQFLARLADDEHCLRARLWATAAYLIGNSNGARAIEAARSALGPGRACGHAATLVEALAIFAFCATKLGRFSEAETALREAEGVTGAPAASRLVLLRPKAMLVMTQGDFAAAADLYAKLRAEHKLLGNADRERNATMSLAEIEHGRGATQRAIDLVGEILPSLSARTDRLLLLISLSNLAAYRAAIDDLPGAIAAAREVIREHTTWIGTGVAYPMEHLALAFGLGGDLRRSAMLEGYADAAFRRYFERELTERMTHDRLTALLRDQLAPDDLARLLAEGEKLTPEAAIALALEER